MQLTSGPGRAGLAVAGVAALGASFLLGVVVAGGAGTTASPTPGSSGPPVTPPLRLANAALTLPGSCDTLLDSYVRRGVERVGPYGWDYPVYAAMESSQPGLALEDAGSAATDARVVEQRSSETGTNVQEAGVDEPDVVKTDGELLVRVRDGELLVLDVTGPTPVQLSDTDLPAAVPAPELLLAGDTVVVLGSTPEGTDDRETRVLTYDLADPAAPQLVDHRGYDGGLVRAVQHGDVVRLVLGTGLPDLDFVEPRFWRGTEDAREKNQEVVEDSEITDWLPTVTTYDAGGRETGSQQLLDCDQVTVPRDAAALGTMAVVGFEADAPGDRTAIGVATDTRLAYVSASRLYLATSSASAWGCCLTVEPVPPVDGPWPRPVPPQEEGRSRVHAFALEGDTATYVASGAVDGVIADRWSMDEHDGVLRLAVGPSVETGNFSSVVTLREDGDDLEEIGRVDRLGVGEEIKAVRWFDDLAIVVTFRQVDPLYPIDLTDPDDPRLLGELKIPGFSEYLHPISGQRLLGIGQDASTSGMVRGAQAALFDVSDLTDPRQTDVVHYRKASTAAAGADPRQFTWLPERDTALTVVSQGWRGTAGWVSVLEVSGDSLSNRMVEVEHGSDVSEVRLVPLPDGRVVLVTSDDVEFFDL